MPITAQRVLRMSLCGAVRLDRESRTAGESAIQATAAGLLAHPVSLRQTFLCQDSKLSTDRGVVQIELMLCSGFHRDVPWRSRHEEQTGRPYPEHPPTPHRAHSTELTAPPLATPLHPSLPHLHHHLHSHHTRRAHDAIGQSTHVRNSRVHRARRVRHGPIGRRDPSKHD